MSTRGPRYIIRAGDINVMKDKKAVNKELTGWL